MGHHSNVLPCIATPKSISEIGLFASALLNLTIRPESNESFASALSNLTIRPEEPISEIAVAYATPILIIEQRFELTELIGEGSMSIV